MSQPPSVFSNLQENFALRHLGPRPGDVEVMLKEIRASSLDELVNQTVPGDILTQNPLDLPAPLTEGDVLVDLREKMRQNQLFRSFIGMGYYGTETPKVILRNILENPGWYTAYTPYQAEIAQGRLEALINFQTMVMELTGMDLANASLLDEGTAAAEAMALAFSSQGKNKTSRMLVDRNVFPQTLEVLATRAEPLGVELIVSDVASYDFKEPVFAVLVQYPGLNGQIQDWSKVIEKTHQHSALAIMAADLLSLCLLKSPGEMGADIVIGTTQRFGVPMGFGGPHAAYFATRSELKRSIPGRIVGVSVDAKGHPAYRLALQTREQHIRREKATSNICTSQVLLAVMASMYAVYHGPQGLKRIADRTWRLAQTLRKGLHQIGFEVSQGPLFDTVEVRLSPEAQKTIRKTSEEKRMNFAYPTANSLLISLDETSQPQDLESIWAIMAKVKGAEAPRFDDLFLKVSSSELPETLLRKSEYLTHPVFNRHHSETELLRYIHHLQSKDLSLTHSMIPLGSCTMKLNATTEMIPVTWPEVAHIHPFAPSEQTKGYRAMIHELEGMLSEITGFAAFSVQPNAGSQGEYAGLLTIRRYHQERGQGHRNICLIPSSAHGTNPASAVMAGMKVVVVQCDDQGNVDIPDLKLKAEEHRENLAALMITYPSTHGVFEEGIREICRIVHTNGGQVYMDGANMNALIGLCRPGEFGPDVAHLNLHKTFCIPHGGGGPGVGPIGVAEHLAPYLPGHSIVAGAGPVTGLTAVAAAPWGSASILPISWSYIRMMGPNGLKKATQIAILNANYIAERLAPHYPVLYRGKNGRVAHECIIDLRPIKSATGITVEDVAKRLMDYGFHAPTMSWPVVGTLMIEPTESEPKEELDRFCEAMISIRKEIERVEKGEWPKDNNPLVHAPHTSHDLVEDWTRPYSRKEAVFPLTWVKEHKFWPAVNRIDNAAGDRNLVCACPPLEDYQS